MPNPSGANGHGKKNYPSDDVLRESLLKYVSRGLRQGAKLERLKADHGLQIGRTKLNEIERRLSIPSVRRPQQSTEALVQSVIAEAEKDIQQNNGPNYIKSQLKNKHITVSRDLVRKVLATHFPDGAEKRFPGHKKNALTPRTPLNALGPFHEVAGDGHEKLGALALNMGGLGLPIYGYRDKWSGTALQLRVVPDCRSQAVVGHLYLDLIEEYGGIPIQLNLDKGSEIGHQISFQVIARELCSPDIDSDEFSEFELLKSVHNIVIEMLWTWLRKKTGHNLREIIEEGKINGFINHHLDLHRNLFYWIFVPVVQHALDEFRVYWNQHEVRVQDAKFMPSGHVPIDALEHPGQYGGTDCLIPVPQHIVDEFRAHLSEDPTGGSYEECMAFYPADFGVLATSVYEDIGSPEITQATAWSVFRMMANAMGN